MKIGLGLDHSLGLTFEEHRRLAAEAAGMGYTSLCTPAGIGRDAFAVCAQWFLASGLPVGISVVPAPLWSVVTLASVAATTAELCEGKFTLGVGLGSYLSPATRRQFGLGEHRPLALMRAYMNTLHGLLAGDTVDVQGAITLRGVRLPVQAPRVPLYLGALGPQMLRLAGQTADGVALNWCAADTVAASRAEVAAGAQASGRDASEISVHEYIRVSVSEDVPSARRSVARAILPYLMVEPGVPATLAYPGHFRRMGFGSVIDHLTALRDTGASTDALAEAIPDDLLRSVSAFGPAEQAMDSFRALAEGLDEPIVRVVPAAPGPEAIRAVMEACRPDRLR